MLHGSRWGIRLILLQKARLLSFQKNIVSNFVQVIVMVGLSRPESNHERVFIIRAQDNSDCVLTETIQANLFGLGPDPNRMILRLIKQRVDFAFSQLVAHKNPFLPKEQRSKTRLRNG